MLDLVRGLWVLWVFTGMANPVTHPGPGDYRGPMYDMAMSRHYATRIACERAADAYPPVRVGTVTYWGALCWPQGHNGWRPGLDAFDRDVMLFDQARGRR